MSRKRKSHGRTLFAATHLIKETTELDDSGEETSVTRITMDDRCHATSDTLKGLIDKLNDTYALGTLSMKSLHLPFGKGEAVVRFNYNRHENDDGNELNDSETMDWIAGGSRIRVWNCEYSFSVERRVVYPLTRKDFDYAQIETY